jgi:hypothetical protein
VVTPLCRLASGVAVEGDTLASSRTASMVIAAMRLPPARVDSSVVGWPARTGLTIRERESPAGGAFQRCAEEDSNLHPVIPDQALKSVGA